MSDVKNEIRNRLTKSPRRFHKETIEGFDYWLQSLSELEASEASAAALSKTAGFDMPRFKRELLIRALVTGENGERVFSDSEQKELLGDGTPKRLTHALTEAVDRMNSGGDVEKKPDASTETGERNSSSD